MILVTGAAGKTGRAIIQELLARGQQVRALVRSQEQVLALQRAGVQEIEIGDLGDQTAVTRAATGAQAIYHICPNMHPNEIGIGAIAICAAQSAGVDHFVYHSVLHPQVEAMPHHWQKMRVEEKLFASGLPFTILQPAAYMQNVLGSWRRILADGVYAVPYALDTWLSMVDLQDVAAAAARVLLEPGHAGAIYELSGAEALTQEDVAQALSRQLKREVQAEVIPIAIWEVEARSAGLSNYAVESLLKMFDYYERYGFCGNAQVLGWLLGRAPTPFDAFLARTVEESGTVG